MPPPLTESHKDRIQQHIFDKRPVAVIAETEHVHHSTVYKIIDNLLAFGSHTAPRISKAGRRLKIHPQARAGLRAFIESKPWSYQDEMQYYLLDVWNIWVDQSTVSDALKEMKINRKSLRRIASERSQICRDAYYLEVSKYTHDMLVFLDESAANEHTMWRKRGWAPYGIKPTISVPVKRSKRWSILPAYTSEGILTHTIHHGSINGDKFRRFLKYQVLPRCTPFPGPRSVLIMDNCSTHHAPGIKELCQQWGVVILYLPPYSPDFNPIEEFFSVLKAWLKRHYELAKYCSFEEFLEVAVQACSGGQHAKAHFEHSSIKVDERGEMFEEL